MNRTDRASRSHTSSIVQRRREPVLTFCWHSSCARLLGNGPQIPSQFPMIRISNLGPSTLETIFGVDTLINWHHRLNFPQVSISQSHATFWGKPPSCGCMSFSLTGKVPTIGFSVDFLRRSFYTEYFEEYSTWTHRSHVEKKNALFAFN